jgi:hypothetical protein
MTSAKVRLHIGIISHKLPKNDRYMPYRMKQRPLRSGCPSDQIAKSNRPPTSANTEH